MSMQSSSDPGGDEATRIRCGQSVEIGGKHDLLAQVSTCHIGAAVCRTIASVTPFWHAGNIKLDGSRRARACEMRKSSERRVFAAEDP
jgi:hypothetical protein